MNDARIAVTSVIVPASKACLSRREKFGCSPTKDLRSACVIDFSFDSKRGGLLRLFHGGREQVRVSSRGRVSIIRRNISTEVTDSVRRLGIRRWETT